MRVLLTGATGYIGSAIANALQAEGHHVIGLARTDKAAQQLNALGFEALQGDIKDPDQWIAAVHQVDGVVHTAATKDAAMPQIDQQVVQAILSAMAGTHKPFLYTSGTWILGNTHRSANNSNTDSADDYKPYPLNPIPLMAWRVDIEAQVLAAQEQQVRSVIIRPGMIYGHGGGLVAQLVASGQQTGIVKFVGKGDNHWALVHVEDLAQGYVLALARSPAGKVFNLASDCTLTLRDIAHLASQAAGVPSQVESQSIETARQERGPLIDGLILDQQFTSFPAKELLGWQPSAPTLHEELTQFSYTTDVKPPTVEGIDFGKA